MRLRHPFARVVEPPEPAGRLIIVTLLGAVALVAALGAVATVSGRSLSPLSWHLVRSSGLTLYLLLWLATVTGFGLTTRLLDRFGGRGVVHSVHDFATQLAYGLLALHLLGLLVDPTVSYGPRELLKPFATGWREPWTGLGVLAAEGFVLIGISAGLRRWIGYPAWHWLHALTPAVYVAALLHGVFAGSDTGEPWTQTIYLATGAVVLLMALYRALRGGAREPRGSAPQAAPFDQLARQRRRPEPIVRDN
jgi:sulfoxide reductase heme-binding subunit YedZ